MPRKKEVVPPPPEPSQQEIETGLMEFESTSLAERAAAELPPGYVTRLKKIAYYTAKVGLPLEESCVLVDYPFEQFQEDMKMHPIIAQVIRAKEVEYEKDLLYTLSQKARSGDDKLAQWLLERKHPEKYGEKKPRKGDNDGTADIVREAFKFVREFGDSSPLISPTQAQHAVVLEASGERVPVRVLSQLDVHERIDKILENGPPTD